MPFASEVWLLELMIWFSGFQENGLSLNLRCIGCRAQNRKPGGQTLVDDWSRSPVWFFVMDSRGAKQPRPCVFHVSPEDVVAELPGHIDLHRRGNLPGPRRKHEDVEAFSDCGNQHGLKGFLNQRTPCRQTEGLNTPVEGIRDGPARYQCSTFCIVSRRAGARC